MADASGRSPVGYEVNGAVQCNQLRLTNVDDTIHMPDCIAMYAFCTYTLYRTSGKGTDLNYSALHDGERLEHWLSKINPTGYY